MRSLPTTIDLDNFNGVISEIYEAALDETRWPEVLRRIVQLNNARSGLLRVQNLHTNEVGTCITHGLDPAFQQRYKDHYIHIDTLVPTVARQPVGSIHAVTNIMPAEFFKGEFYNDYALPQGQETTVGCILTRQRSQLAVLGLHRTNRRAGYEQEELALLESLVPHLQNALKVGQRLLRSTTERTTFHEVLHRLSIGVILVDASGKPLFLNRQAEAIVTDGLGLVMSRGVLRARSPPDNQTLHKLIFAAARAPQRSGGEMAISDPVLPQPLSILVTPVGKEQSSGFQLDDSHVAAALFVGSAGQQLEFSLDALSQLYSLTRAEARLAAALANGQSPEMIANQFGLSLHTIRSQLKTCFRKTNTNRQIELVKLVLCAPAALVDNGEGCR